MSGPLAGPVLGCIADDYTGGTDVAAALRRAGLRTVLLFGAPQAGRRLPPCDAVVVALKSRTVAAPDAVAQSVNVQRWLREQGVGRLYFKYCSTFDSTDAGNIGPVADALLDAAGAPMTLICPASPEHGRTVYRGHLFVGDIPLSESPMRHHPLTPMTDANLVRVMSRQTSHRVGLLPLDVVRAGHQAVTARLAQLRADAVRHVVVDATDDTDLDVVATAAASFAVLTGGAGLARAVGAAARGVRQDEYRHPVALPAGPGLVLAGSCSAATLAQVDHARTAFPSHRLDPAATPDPDELLATATAWLREHIEAAPLMLYSSAPVEQRRAAVAALGPGTAEILEQTLGALARTAVALGVRRLVVAGGETSGAVVSALGVDAVVVADEEDRGVPWCLTPEPPVLGLLLKSGNFGRPDLLVRAVKGAA
ncbi:3-oxo-tetronate kinase [Micromonospora sp. NPDC051296]|uniref:3-oxo-tetronate kinase n=1 Tax=Micromonospora sp. NPDC051296 TaxID=3155046 RepID=UPI003435BB6F